MSRLPGTQPAASPRRSSAGSTAPLPPSGCATSTPGCGSTTSRTPSPARRTGASGSAPDEVMVGAYTPWDVDVRNVGEGAASHVDVTFEFSGAISGALFVTPNDFACAGEGARIACQGRLAGVKDSIGSWGIFTVWV